MTELNGLRVTILVAVDREVVVDKMLISSRKPADIPACWRFWLSQ